MFTTDRVVHTTDRVMRTTDREYVHTTVSLNKKHNESDNEMVQLTKIILKQTARHTQPNCIVLTIHLIMPRENNLIILKTKEKTKTRFNIC